MVNSPAPLLQAYLPQLRAAAKLGPILDMGCGSGRNGLLAVAHDIPVIFADINAAALQQIENELATEQYQNIDHPPQLWQVDLEKPASAPLSEKRLGGVIVFRYLHRPLFADIKAALLPGGIVVYETFTVDQAQFGRPSNPDFLLRHGELQDHFSNWKIIHSFEGVVAQKNGDQQQAIAQIVAVKPD
jgi:tellurite methyltransferase